MADRPATHHAWKSSPDAHRRQTHTHTARTASPPDPTIRMDWTTWWPWRGARTRSHPELGRENPQRPWYCVSRHGRVGRRQVFQSIPNTPITRAGWSSPVARQAHNLKVTGSNPVPATRKTAPNQRFGAFLILPIPPLPIRMDAPWTHAGRKSCVIEAVSVCGPWAALQIEHISYLLTDLCRVDRKRTRATTPVLTLFGLDASRIVDLPDPRHQGMQFVSLGSS